LTGRNPAREALRQEPRTHAEALEIGYLSSAVGHGTGCQNLSGGDPFQAVEIRPREAGHIELNVACFDSEVEGRGAPAIFPQSHSGQQVLAGMLLHVVPAPRPVELEPNRTLGHRLRQKVTDLLPALLHIEDRRLTEATVVSGLTTALRIKEGVGEGCIRRSVLVAGCHHVRHELGEITIAKIGGLGHSHSSTSGSATVLGPNAKPLRRGSPTPEKIAVVGS
jgi:hypothetical protein